MVELPAGSREVEGAVNLVDADAAAELEAWLFDNSAKHAALRHGLNKSLNLFLEHYAEDYDFLFLVTAAELEDVPVAGRFEAARARTMTSRKPYKSRQAAFRRWRLRISLPVTASECS